MANYCRAGIKSLRGTVIMNKMETVGILNGITTMTSIRIMTMIGLMMMMMMMMTMMIIKR
jgi:hypothetical protein